MSSSSDQEKGTAHSRRWRDRNPPSRKVRWFHSERDVKYMKEMIKHLQISEVREQTHNWCNAATGLGLHCREDKGQKKEKNILKEKSYSWLGVREEFLEKKKTTKNSNWKELPGELMAPLVRGPQPDLLRWIPESHVVEGENRRHPPTCCNLHRCTLCLHAPPLTIKK